MYIHQSRRGKTQLSPDEPDRHNQARPTGCGAMDGLFWITKILNLKDTNDNSYISTSRRYRFLEVPRTGSIRDQKIASRFLVRTSPGGQSHDRIKVYERSKASVRPREINNLVEVHVFHSMICSAIEQDQRPRSAPTVSKSILFFSLLIDHAASRKKVGFLAAEKDANLILKWFSDFSTDDIWKMRISVGRAINPPPRG